MDPTTRATRYVVNFHELSQDTQDTLLQQEDYDESDESDDEPRRTPDPETLGLLQRFPNLRHGDLVSVVWDEGTRDTPDSQLFYHQHENRWYQSHRIGDFTDVVPVEMGVFHDFHPFYWHGLIEDIFLEIRPVYNRPLDMNDFFSMGNDGLGRGIICLPIVFDKEVYYLDLGAGMEEEIQEFLGYRSLVLVLENREESLVPPDRTLRLDWEYSYGQQ